MLTILYDKCLLNLKLKNHTDNYATESREISSCLILYRRKAQNITLWSRTDTHIISGNPHISDNQVSLSPLYLNKNINDMLWATQLTALGPRCKPNCDYSKAFHRT